jgi:hypothetical protein
MDHCSKILLQDPETSSFEEFPLNDVRKAEWEKVKTLTLEKKLKYQIIFVLIFLRPTMHLVVWEKEF